MMLMVDMIRKFYFMVIMLMTCSFIIGQDVSLSMGNVDEQNGTFDILYDTQQNIYGFQLEIAGVGILDATSDYFDVMFNSEEEAGVIIGFSMSEDPAISPGVGVLASIMYQLEPWPSDICIHNSILSSDDSIALESTNGECYSVSGTVPIMISFGEVDLANRILEINYASYVEIQGFQLNVSGATILDVSNEYLSNIEFDSMTGSILAIDFSGNVVPLGSGILLEIHFEEIGELEACINNAIFTSDFTQVNHQFEDEENCVFMPAALYDCYGVPNGDAVLDECGVCNGNGMPDGACDCLGNVIDCFDVCGGSSVLDVCDVCDGDGLSCFLLGDLNFDGEINVIDVIVLVGIILPGGDPPSEEQLLFADVNEDGDINILDVVALTHIALSGGELARGKSASEFILYHGNGVMEHEADGNIAGIQLEVSGNHEIIGHDLPAGWLMHHGDGTILLHAMDGSSLQEKILFTYSGEMHVESIIVADWHGSSIDVSVVSLPDDYILSPAYPNPFNPTTTLNLTLLVKEKVSVQVYNMQGQQVASLHDGAMEAGNHSLTWNADAHGSGIYFVKMLAGEHQSMQKITLIK